MIKDKALVVRVGRAQTLPVVVEVVALRQARMMLRRLGAKQSDRKSSHRRLL